MIKLQEIKKNIQDFLAEDVGEGDVTAAIVQSDTKAKAEVVTREFMTVCGQQWFNEVFAQLNQDIKIEWQVAEGDQAEAGDLLCQLSGPARALLTGERTALNILQTLSATATTARLYADAVSGTACKVLDTRKTLPGLRLAQKYAVQCGGCYNHRFGLYDAVLIKENHILAAGSISSAVQSARQTTDVLIEVEVENLQEFQEAVMAVPDRIMLDNFSREDLQQAVASKQGTIELEASGNIDLQNIQEIAASGVDYISIGALTKNIQAIDLSMRIKFEES